MIRTRSFHGVSWAFLLLLFVCLAFDGTNAFLYPSSVRLLQWRKSSSSQRFSSTSSSSSSSGESSATQRLTSTTPSTPPQQQRRDFEIRPLFSSLVTAGNNSSSNNKATWMSTIQGISNVASVLCVLDCTVLPLLTLTLPLVGWWSGGPGLQHTLCVWSHHLALYFVLPLGSFMSLWNYYMGGHSQKTVILSLAWGGLLLIGITNVALPESILAAFSSSTKMTMVLEALHHGMWHRIVNLVGCAMLLGSNYLAQLLGCCCGLAFCVPSNKLLQVAAVAPVQQRQQQQTKMMIPYKYHHQQQQMVIVVPPFNDNTNTNNNDNDVEGDDVSSTRSPSL